MDYTLIISAFFAGILMFFAPCTFPLIPGYLGFLSGLSSKELTDETRQKENRRKILAHALFYIFGFSLVFIIFGIAASGTGLFLFAYRPLLQKLGGIFIILLGLFLMGLVRFPFLQKEAMLNLPEPLRKYGKISSFLFGASIAFGWTPCIGPILGAVLTVAAAKGEITQGFILLSVFSLGLAVPFLLAALGLGKFIKIIQNYGWILNGISVLSGLLLIFVGILIFTDNFTFLISYGYWLFRFINYQSLINYL